MGADAIVRTLSSRPIAEMVGVEKHEHPVDIQPVERTVAAELFVQLIDDGQDAPVFGDTGLCLPYLKACIDLTSLRSRRRARFFFLRQQQHDERHDR